MGSKATNACQYDQLCAGLKSRIGGAVYRVQAIWYANLFTEDWGFLLIVAKNAFNEINQIIMLWTVHHLCLSGSCFVFNCYRHWSSLVLRNRNGEDIFLNIS